MKSTAINSIVSNPRQYAKYIALVQSTLLVLMAMTAAEGLENDRTKEVLQASEVLDKIKAAEPIAYEHKIIKGHLDINTLDLPQDEKGRRIINTPISITNSIIDGNIIFKNAIFQKNVKFYNTSINGISDFSYSIFTDQTSFRKTHFNDETNFLYSDFNSDAFFIGAIFNRTASFWEVNFMEDVDFGSAEFHKAAIFNFGNFKGNGYFNNAKFYDSLDLNEAKFSKLEIKWNSINDKLKFNEDTLISLINNYRYLGWFEDADNSYYQYRLWRQDERRWSFSRDGLNKLLDKLSQFSFGYGVRPGCTLAWSFILVGAFGILFLLGKGIYRPSTLTVEKQSSSSWNLSIYFNNMSAPIQISLIDALYFSTMVFFSRSPQQWQPKGKWKYVVMIEGIMGWLLLALFIVALIKTTVRY